MKLTAEEIEDKSEELQADLSKLGVERVNLLRLRLSFEEVLLRMQERFGEDVEVEVAVRKGIAGSYVSIRSEGDPFNPLGVKGAVLDAAGSSFFASMGLLPQYAYAGGVNIMRLPFPRTGTNPAVSLVLGIVAGVLLGLIGVFVISDDVQQLIASTVLTPLFGMWERALNALAAPVILLMVVTTLLNMRRIEAHGGKHQWIVAGYFIISYVVAFIGVAAAIFAVGLPVEIDQIQSSVLSELLDNALQLVPQNIVDPFITSNTPQLLLIAFVLGNALLALGDRVSNLVTGIQQLNMTTSLITKWMSNFVPLVTCLMLGLEIWQGQVGLLLAMWKPLALSLAVCLVVMLIDVISTSLQFGIPIPHLAKALTKPFLLTLKTGSLEDAYGEVERSCTRDLGIDRDLTNVMLQQGLVLYMPASIMGTLIFTVAAAFETGVEVSLLWYLLAIALDVVLFVATPPVPGANLLAFITLFNVLGIPRVALLDAMVFDILFGIFANAANQAMLQTQMLRSADHMGMVKRKKAWGKA